MYSVRGINKSLQWVKISNLDRNWFDLRSQPDSNWNMAISAYFRPKSRPKKPGEEVLLNWDTATPKHPIPILLRLNQGSHNEPVPQWHSHNDICPKIDSHNKIPTMRSPETNHHQAFPKRAVCQREIPIMSHPKQKTHILKLVLKFFTILPITYL